MLTDVVIEDPRWREIGIEALAERAAQAALAHLDIAAEGREIAVLACADARIAELNASFRGKAVPTNVLSWPSAERAAESAGAVPDLPDEDEEELGDIAIAYDTCAREAAEAGKPLAEHATHLIVHAVLHLLGYDHERDEDATLMERLETGILVNMGMPSPYD